MNKNLVAAALVFACCVAAPAPLLEDAEYAASLGVDISASTKIAGMYTRDIVVGDGVDSGVEGVRPGDGGTPRAGELVTMRYTGWLSDGGQFDSNQGSGFQFRLGAGSVIQGWEVGVPGMNVGGERQLIIPPSLGYGEEGAQGIPANSILVFNVKLLRANP